VILKPGPWICAEWKNGGLPGYLFDDGTLVARNANDEPVHAGNCADIPKGFAPCYAHPDYLKHVRRYYNALAQAIKEHVHPSGNIFLIQLDNELSFCFQSKLLDADYHELVTTNLYPRYLKDKYKEIERLNAMYLTDLKDFAACAPPRKLEVKTDRDLNKYFDWLDFKERYLATYLVQLRKMFTDLAINTGFSTNIRWESDFVAPTNWPMFEKYGGLAGVDIYWPHSHYEVQRYIRYTLSTSKMAWSPEFMAGLWSNDPEGSRKFKPISEREQRFITLSSMAAGLRGANFYMFVERDHWYDSPVANNGERAKNWDFYKKLNEIIDDNDYYEVEKINNTAVVHYQPYTRYSHIDPEKPFDHIKTLSRHLLPDLCSNLGQLGVHDVLFIPVADFLDDTATKLYSQLAEKGKHLIFFGTAPTLDNQMRKSQLFSDTFGIKTVNHLVVEQMRWGERSFRTFGTGRLRPAEGTGWETMVSDERGNIYAARRSFGQGSVYFIGFDFTSDFVPGKHDFLDSVLSEAGALRPVRVEEPIIEAYMRVSEKHRFLFLINPNENRREESRPSVRQATLTLDLKALSVHADSITFVNMFTGEKRNEPLSAVRTGLEFEIEDYDAQMWEVIPEYGR